jgi:hypothetical protein
MADRVFKAALVIREPQGARVQRVERDSLDKSVISVIEVPLVLQDTLVLSVRGQLVPLA